MIRYSNAKNVEREKTIKGRLYFLLITPHAYEQAHLPERNIMVDDIMDVLYKVVDTLEEIDVPKNKDGKKTFVVYSPADKFSFSCEVKGLDQVVVTTAFAPGLQNAAADQLIFEYNFGKKVIVKRVADYQ